MGAYKDKNGTWYAQFRFTNWKGEPDRKTKRGFATKKEALDWERDFLTQSAGNLEMTFEAFYYIGERFWGKGIATCAVKQICDYIFKNTDIIRIFAEPFARNAASCRVLEKAGFQYEGTLRNNAVKNGSVLDMKLYAILKKDSAVPC